jgi:DNA polymerase-3 subunit gamma/tau
MNFRDLIGQEHVARSLANAIEQDRVAHAFLFTGVRGVGKTTSARILAKALNCLQRGAGSAERGIEPCLECAACREIAEGVDVDVREIDGASYTGVDEIRKLQESLPYRPARDRYKIFIVDEVHMLSQNAWNALLKTLEEPPPHVKFILATTEVHKVPVTILSRVQRFDFKMIPSRLIAERLRGVLQAERIAADERAVTLVAREAAGSMRDALSLLDQVIAFNPEQLLGDDVARVLGVAGHASLLEIASAVLAGEPARALSSVAALAQQGSDLTVAARHLVALFRDLVVAKLCKEGDDLLDLSDEERRGVRALAERTDAQDLLRLQQGFAKGFDDISRAAEPRTALEMLLARLALRPALLPIDGLLARLGELEARLEGGKASPPGGGPGRAGGPGNPPRGASRPGPAPAPAGPSASAAPEQTASSLPAVSGPAVSGAAAPGAAAPGAAAPVRAVPAAPAAVAAAPGAAAASAAAPVPERAAAPLAAAAAPAPPPDSPLDLTDWRRVLSQLEETRPDLVAFLKHAVPLGFTHELITLGYEPGNALEASLRSAECLRELRTAALKCLGREPNVLFQAVASGTETLADVDRRAREKRRKAAVDLAQQHPSVRDAAEILGARVKRVELGGEN